MVKPLFDDTWTGSDDSCALRSLQKVPTSCSGGGERAAARERGGAIGVRLEETIEGEAGETFPNEVALRFPSLGMLAFVNLSFAHITFSGRAKFLKAGGMRRESHWLRNLPATIWASLGHPKPSYQ